MPMCVTVNNRPSHVHGTRSIDRQILFDIQFIFDDLSLTRARSKTVDQFIRGSVDSGTRKASIQTFVYFWFTRCDPNRCMFSVEHGKHARTPRAAANGDQARGLMWFVSPSFFYNGRRCGCVPCVMVGIWPSRYYLVTEAIEFSAVNSLL
jgi:hypothetical protein